MYAVIKVRGSNHTEVGIRRALLEMRLDRINHLVLVPETEIGQIKKAKDYITWGEVDSEHLTRLIQEKGRMSGEKKVDSMTLKELGFGSFEEMAEKIINGGVRMKDIPNFKPVFRMNPPRKGYRSTKRTFDFKGALGYRGAEINSLIDSMLEGGELGKRKD